MLAVFASVLTVERLRLSQHEHHRQLHADRIAHTNALVTQVTDLSAKASEQLGSDSAAVRIGGLTDLERLGQNFPELRQVVIDRICAYLRSPYRIPTAAEEGSELAAKLELDVRRTAQSVVQRHMRWPADIIERPARFWDTVTIIDLRDAVLVELDLSDCRLPDIDLRGAKFYTTTSFRGAQFSGSALFWRASFMGEIYFNDTTFLRNAEFYYAAFAGRYTRFDSSTFSDGAHFWGTTFIGMVTFDESRFETSARFDGAVFNGDAAFDGAVFVGFGCFSEAQFYRNAFFAQTNFLERASFSGAYFYSSLYCESAKITSFDTPPSSKDAH